MFEYVLVMWLFAGMLLGVWMVMRASDDVLERGMIAVIKNYTNTLFSKRNCFGVVLSLIVFIITIPSMIELLIIQIIVWMMRIIGCIWEIGNKRSE